MNSPLRLSRRGFIAALQVSAGGLALGYFPGRARAAGKPPAGLRPNVFIHVDSTGLVTCVCHRSEMGQGIRSSYAGLFADELGADLARLKLEQADGDAKYGDQNTDGSSSVRGVLDDLRRTAATARELLVAVAAKRWSVSPALCDARDNAVWHRTTGAKLDFGALADEAGTLPVPKRATLRPLDELKHVGKDMPLLDGPAYVTGAAIFGADVHVPGMLIAVIARPPVVGGILKRFDPAKALAVPGVRKVIAVPPASRPYLFKTWGGVAVLADNTWAAMRGRAALTLEWEHGENAVYDSVAYREALRASVNEKGSALREVGDVDAALATAARTIDAEYHVPHLAHVPMEPPVALVRLADDGTAEVWASTQNPQEARSQAAKELGLKEEQVTVHVTFLGGGFGRKSKADFVAEAAYLAKEAKAPVRVQWTREDDVRHDYYNTVSTQKLTAGLDAKGKVVAWRHRTAFPPIASLFVPPIASIIISPVRPAMRDLQQGVLDFASVVPNLRAEACEATPHVRIGWLRSVYNVFHAFSEGCFIDELAQARGSDVRDLWLELIGPPRKCSLEELGISSLDNYGATLEDHPVDAGRLRNVLERVTASAGWASRKAKGRSLGLAVHRSFLSYVAVVVSAVQDASGRVRIDEAWMSMDAGQLLNTDRVRSQLEGAFVFGLSHALYGGATMKGGATEQSNFHDYKLARIAEVPRQVHLDLVPSTEKPGGVGEPGVPPVAPAIANAIFALTGKRIRALPLRDGVKV